MAEDRNLIEVPTGPGINPVERENLFRPSRLITSIVASLTDAI
jgi:hypothetical protein